MSTLPGVVAYALPRELPRTGLEEGAALADALAVGWSTESSWVSCGRVESPGGGSGTGVVLAVKSNLGVAPVNGAGK